MCLIAFAWQAHPDHPLVVAGNRDEFFARPTAPADWSHDERVLAGRDLRAGGTWMGVSRGGRFAALTNHRDPTALRPDAPSRGELVDRFLSADGPASPVLDAIAREAGRYNGFNLLAARWTADAADMWIVSGPVARRVAPGVHALSNARLDTPWPKVERAIERTRDAIDVATGTDTLIDGLFAMLGERSVADDAKLPRTGVPLDVERALSAAFIRMPGYGTRSSTVLVVDRRGRCTFVERRCEPGAPSVDRRFVFERITAVRVP